MGSVRNIKKVKSMKDCNLIIIVLVGSMLISDLKEGKHVDHVPETTHEVQNSLIVSYDWIGTITGSFNP